ncbi:MAG: ABC transporter permease [Paracoccaceae bacterium]|nr:MAG: ABC transporter permease [Paracoccaceae bacterium]
MFERPARLSPIQSAFGMAELVFHAAVRHVRKSHGNALIGLLLNIFQTVLLVAVFYLMFELLGMRGSAVRGDFVLYVMSGIFMFMTHVKALGAVSGAEGPTSPMMKHSPMNTLVAIAAAALSALYLQFLSAAVVLAVYHAAFSPITVYDPVGAIGMFLLAWASGVGLGIIVQAAKPWWPEAVTMITQTYQRANMIFSGKMFVANMMPGYLLGYFDWNPLFHIIDQCRGYLFLNYSPHYTSLSYPLYATLAFFMLGLMAEFYTRKHASASWGAGK